MAETLAESLRVHDPVDGMSRREHAAGERLSVLMHVLDIPDDYDSMGHDLVELLGDPVADLLGLVR